MLPIGKPVVASVGDMLATIYDLDVRTQNASDGAEGAVQAARKFTHSSRGREGNQRQNQEVFHQALTFFVSVQAG